LGGVENLALSLKTEKIEKFQTKLLQKRSRTLIDRPVMPT